MAVPPYLQKIGGFFVRAELGRGAFGTVYRVHDPALGVERALKLFSSTIGEQARERFVREAALLVRIAPHPN
ncbi:MAG: hypothetical protein ACAI25_05130, partial [Planctomycetota bacterium]